jgi:hypothetical protein
MVKERQTSMKDFKYPSPEELYAFEQWARHQRSKELARILIAGASAVKSLLARGFAPSANTVRQHVVHHA